MKRQLTIILACLSMIAFSSCKEDDGSYVNRVPIFNVTGPENTEGTEISISGKAQTVNFTVMATGEWTASVSNDAYSLTPTTGGTGKTAVSLATPSNESGTVYNAVVKFTLNGGKSYEFNVAQAAQQPYLEVDLHDVAITGDGEEFTVNVDTNQPEWTYEFDGTVSWIKEKEKTATSVTFTVPENLSGSKRSADIRFYAVAAPELMDYVAVSQTSPVPAPTADLLDVVFNSDATAKDVSPMSMTVNSDRLDADVSSVWNHKYNCNCAIFNNSTIARMNLEKGYYYIPYTTTSDFAKKLEDGFTYELVFCSYTEPTAIQVKPFASTQAGGIGMCFRAKTGEINFEVHVGGSWCELYSGVLPQKNQYYHVVATWDKANGLAMLYVDGKLTASANTTGDLKFMTTSLDKRWFGIGADPSGSDLGEASFHGEVVKARLYSEPVSAEEVKALYKLVK